MVFGLLLTTTYIYLSRPIGIVQNAQDWYKMQSEVPTQAARKEMMKVARSKKLLDNSFFISKETGEITSRAYRDDKSYFPNIPKNTYEVHIRKCPFFSYLDLDEQIESIMAMVYQEDEMSNH